MTGKTKLFTLLGDYPNTLALKRGEIGSDLVDVEFSDIKVANTGFKPLVREAKFDLAELAIVTYLQAKAYGKPYTLLPAPVVARGQHHTLAYNRERGHLEPADLVGKRVGVRAYSVTTGVWVRGILQEQFGVDIDKIRWVTFEDPHVAEYCDPPTVERAPSSRNLAQMLIDGELDAAIVGDKLPDPRLAMLIPDSEMAASAWAESTAHRSITWWSYVPKFPKRDRKSRAKCSGCSRKAAMSLRGTATRAPRNFNSESRQTEPGSNRSSTLQRARSSFPANGGSRSYSTT
jgi:4,5-dihydroxyphthalate decarboxylase